MVRNMFRNDMSNGQYSNNVMRHVVVMCHGHGNPMNALDHTNLNSWDSPSTLHRGKMRAHVWCIFALVCLALLFHNGAAKKSKRWKYPR